MKRKKVLNYATDKQLQVLGADQVPTLLDPEKFRAILGNDTTPYFKIQAIQYPIRGTGGVYEEPFFQSFIDVTKERPIPGAKRGHWRANRPESDFYMVGGLLKPNGDGTGVVYLKNYIPPMGDGSDNARFIQDNKVGIVNFSLVTAPAYTVDENGIYHFTRSEGYERNDAVEYGSGAMKQTTNEEFDSFQEDSLENLNERISEGDVDKTSAWSFSAQDGDRLLGPNGDDWDTFAKWHLIENDDQPEETKARYSYPYGKGGLVYRSALRSIASRSAQQGLNDLSKLASEMILLIDKGENMTKEEMLTKLASMKNSGDLTTQEITKAFSLKLENAEELTTLKTENATLKAEAVKTEQIRLNAFLDTNFGKDGDLRAYAGKMLNSTDSAKLEEFKKDSIALKLAGNSADVTFFGVVENKKDTTTKVVNGVKVQEV